MSLQTDLETCVRYLLGEGQLHEAVAAAEEASALLPSAELFALLGVAHARLGASAQALAALHQATQQDPTQVRYWAYLGEAQLDVLDHEHAATSLAQACALDPDARDPFGKRARLLIARTRRELKTT